MPRWRTRGINGSHEARPAERGRKSQVVIEGALRGLFAKATRRVLCATVLAGVVVAQAFAQNTLLSANKTGTITGVVTDSNDAIVPGAQVILTASGGGERRSVLSGDNGSYSFHELKPNVTYQITIDATGFATWTSPEITLGQDQVYFVPMNGLQFTSDTASVTVYASRDEIAAEQVKMEERQRVFGILPNFYVSYNHDAVALTPKLKFKLALKAGTDPIFFASVALVAGASQAGNTPNYGQGAAGFGQRMGAQFANGFADIMIGEAILPSLLHQDPRYFYQGAATTRSRVLHALSSPFVCKGDNGRWQPNYSSIGGDVAAGALSNIYYPHSNRGPGIVFGNALITTGGRMASGIVEEFVLRRFTPSARTRTP